MLNVRSLSLSCFAYPRFPSLFTVSRDRPTLFAHASEVYDRLERVRKSEERAVVRSRPPAMNLLLCYYCFGRAAHARRLSHSVCPAPLRPRVRVNKPLTHEPRRIDNTPRHATSPFRDLFLFSLSLSRQSIFFPPSSPPPFVVLFTGKTSMHRGVRINYGLSLFLFCIYARNVAKCFQNAYRFVHGAFAYDPFVYIHTHGSRAGDGLNEILCRR